MIPEPRQLIASLEGADVSTLIVTRAALLNADAEGWISREALLAEVREEYRRWFASADTTASPISQAGFLSDPAIRYLDDHALPRLIAAGVLEPPALPDLPPGENPQPGSEAGIRLRAPLAAVPAGDRRAWAAEIDNKIAAALERGPRLDGASDPEPLPAAEEAQTNGHRTVPPQLAPDALTLSSRGLVKSYRRRRVVNEVDVSVTEGEIVGLLGPNGAGKTTTFYMIVGLIPPDRGTVHVGGENITSVPMYKRARRGIGYLAQEPSIFRKLTVEENVLAILQMRGLKRREQRERLEKLLDELGIKHLRDSKAYALSGGERRRLEITRALVGQPRFMLLDEPFAGVDPIAVHDIQQIVADLRRRGIGVLISDHNVEQTLDIVDRAYIMYDGRVRVSGTVSELVWNEEVAEIYLGPTLTARMRARYAPPEQN